MTPIFRCLFLLSFFSFAAAHSPAAQPADSIRADTLPAGWQGRFERFELANGLRVILASDDRQAQISFRVFVDAPPRWEGVKAGVVQLTGVLLGRGSATRSRAQIDATLERIGATFSTDGTGMSGACPAPYQDTLLEIMADVLLNPAFAPAEFDAIKAQALTGLAAARAQPDAVADHVVEALHYGRQHPPGSIATARAIDSITLDDCRAAYQTCFQPDMSYLVIVGNIASGPARALAGKHFGGWRGGEPPRPVIDPPRLPEQRQVGMVAMPDVRRPVLRITYPVAFTPADSGAVAAALLATLLAEKAGKSLDPGGDRGNVVAFRAGRGEMGTFYAGGRLQNEAVDSTLAALIRTMSRLRDSAVSDEELVAAKRAHAAEFSRRREQPHGIAALALETVRFNLPVDFYSNYLAKLDGLTAAAVQAAAHQYLFPDRVGVLVVGNREVLAERLTPFAPEGGIQLFDADGHPADVPEDLTAGAVVERYLQALGGREKLQEVKDLEMRLTASVQGMSVEMIRRQVAPDKMAISVAVNGMVLSEQKYDGTRGAVMQAGQKRMLEGEELQGMALQARSFPEMVYTGSGCRLELAGVENVNGQDAYRVDIVTPSGDELTEFYSVDSGLKLRLVQTRETANGLVTVTNNFGPYQTFDGILFPTTLSVSGMMPVPLKLDVVSVTLNKGIDPTTFRVE